MILAQHWPIYKHLAEQGYIQSPVLMIGAQESRIKEYPTAQEAFRALGVHTYVTVDPDGGTYKLDLNEDQCGLMGRFKTVINIGTLEHVWDAHTAWSNALRWPVIGGHFITLTPVQGWQGHGIHITEGPYIKQFIEKNGYEIKWETHLVEPRGVNMILAAQKTAHKANLTDFAKPQQRYESGRKATAGQ